MNKIYMINDDTKENIDYASLHGYYYECSMNNYDLYKKANEQYNFLITGTDCWDILSHTEEENAKYFTAWSDKQYYAILSVIFQALSVEAWINFYGVKELGIDIYNKEYEKMATCDKYLTIYKKIKSKEFPKGNKEYNNLILLFRIRDRLVHSKAYAINMQSGSGQDFLDSLNELFGGRKSNLFSSIDTVIDTYRLLLLLFLDESNN